MSNNPSNQPPAESRKFIPEVKPLESRVLLSQSQRLSFPDGTSFIFPTFVHLPRTGGVSVQMGTVLGIGVGQTTTNKVQVTSTGEGGVLAEWNRGPVHSFTGIDSAVIQVERAKRDQITFNLTGNRTSGTDVAVGSRVPTDVASSNEDGHPLKIRVARTSGAAVQSGSVLTVTVDKSTSNTVEISNERGGAVQVEWNGGVAHAFTGVTTIVVDTHNARKDLVAIDNVTD